MPDARAIMSHARESGEDQSLRFPVELAVKREVKTALEEFLGSDRPCSIEEVEAVLEKLSGRMRDLAKEFNCLGYFDDDGDGGSPRAA